MEMSQKLEALKVTLNGIKGTMQSYNKEHTPSVSEIRKESFNATMNSQVLSQAREERK